MKKLVDYAIFFTVAYILQICTLHGREFSIFLYENSWNGLEEKSFWAHFIPFVAVGAYTSFRGMSTSPQTTLALGAIIGLIASLSSQIASTNNSVNVFFVQLALYGNCNTPIFNCA